MENEIVGDLVEEFTVVPDRAEEIPLDKLAADIQATVLTSQLGKKSIKLIAKEISGKMPVGFSIQIARQYLQQHWGLPSGIQDAVLLTATLEAPPSRLKDTKDAKSFFDDVYRRYAAQNGLEAVAVEGQIGTECATLSPELSNYLLKEQGQFYHALLELCARTLKLDATTGDKVELQAFAECLQAKLDAWVSEHGETYASGIEPIMSREKARVYDSSWNWTLVALLRTYYDLCTGALQPRDDAHLKEIVTDIASRSSPGLSKVISSLLQRGRHGVTQRPVVSRFLEDMAVKCTQTWNKPPAFVPKLDSPQPQTRIKDDGTIEVFEIPRYSDTDLSLAYIDESSREGNTRDVQLHHQQPPLLHLKARKGSDWSFDKGLTDIYFSEARAVLQEGLSLENKYVLVTGAGQGSIGSHVLRGLLGAGAQVVVTTSSYSLETTKYFQALYESSGSRTARLTVVPCNMGSVRDVEALIDWIYDDTKSGGLGYDLDYILPFAAVSENGREVDDIDSRSELAHRVMLTNTMRLLGAVIGRKRGLTRRAGVRPAQVILPLSPNHGIFGGDGLYSESKLGLESLMRKWRSEGWSDMLSICGCSIGWTRSTGLMSENDIVASDVETKLGVRTFSATEMAFNILVLMSPTLVDLCEDEPVYADFGAGLDLVNDFKLRLDEIRAQLHQQSDIQRAIFEEDAAGNSGQPQTLKTSMHRRRALMDVSFPKLSSFEETVSELGDKLEGMVDLDRVVVITGFGEIGPWGSSRTRWEMEAYGQFSLEGCVEMAWIMGLIRYYSGPCLVTGKPYTGWVDTATDQPVADMDVKAKYEQTILSHSGIRLVEAGFWGASDKQSKLMLKEVLLDQDMGPFEASEQEADEFKREHGDKVDIQVLPSGQYNVRLRKGALLVIPRALNMGRLVTGQIPSGWDAQRYGIPPEIISQVDRITLFALVSTAEALLASGITDAYELYQYVHLAEVGNCLGTGNGPAKSQNKMFLGRMRDQPVQNDVLQETFLNTAAAWVNMLMLSSTGPIRTPVGACATGLESLDTAFDLITAKKVRACVVGAVDDMEEHEVAEFGYMKATANADADAARGRTPQELSRPTTSTRCGFVEAEGGGVQIVMSASLALEMGVPIYAVVALTGMAGDKVSRSVPAPGKGVLSMARETSSARDSLNPLVDLQYRKKVLRTKLSHIEELRVQQLGHLETGDDNYDNEAALIEQQAQRDIADARFALGNGFWAGLGSSCPSISPLRGALAVWGLQVDDIGFVSFHGTSTTLNDSNELDIIQRQMQHLGRQPGNVLLGIFQKHLTGHPKGTAASWMLNGCLQTLGTGLVPGNRNADNIDQALRKFDLVAIPNQSIQTDGMSAFVINSFGFGQKGAQAVGVHPRFLFATLEKARYETYRLLVSKRRQKAEQWLERGMMRGKMVSVKDEPPYGKDEELGCRVTMDPTARATRHDSSGSYVFT